LTTKVQSSWKFSKGEGCFFICFEILLSDKGVGVKKTDRTSHTKQNGNAVETALPSIKKQ